MATLELALILMATVLLSAILDQLMPRLSLPLIQIALGVIVGLISTDRITITLNPEIFLVLFIAPLLFHEAREANNLSLWKNRRMMLSYAIGLVIAIVLIVGFVVNLITPSIPLACAFALGAALGPTDPIAVASISERAKIPDRLKITLQGESLLNDASGIVSFQFAVAAVVTGAFSLTSALKTFAIEFFGALIVGIAIGFVLVKFIDLVRGWGLENTTFHVSLELLTPFITYLIGDALHVSGVIVVVACGITMSLVPRNLAPSMSRMSIVSSSVWQVLTFALNGIVFVLLGTQLPQSFGDLWIEEGISNFHLVLLIVVITLLMHGTRFVWSLISDAFSFRAMGEKVGFAARMRSAAITTLAGSKGAITLAIMFSLPQFVNSNDAIVAFPQRDLLIFLSCGVILLSLLLATFVVPLLAPRERNVTEERERLNEARADILRSVVEELTARQTPENRAAINKVIAQYNERIERFKEKKDLEDDSDVDLRIQVLQWEQEYVFDLIERDEIPPLEGYQYISRAAHMESMLRRGKSRSIAVIKYFRRLRVIFRKTWNRLRGRKRGEGPQTSGRIMRDIQVKSSVHVIERLTEIMPESDLQTEKISTLILEYRRTVALLRGPAPSITAIARDSELDLDATRMGLRIELEKIQQAYEDGRITRSLAQRMRENVYLMQIDLEDYV